MSAINIRTWSDARAFIHVAAPTISAALVLSGVADENLATKIVTLVIAIFSPTIATINTLNGFRQWFYPVLGAASLVLIYLGLFTEAQFSIWLPVITLIVGSGVAAANTPTTVDGEVVAVRDTEI